MGGGKSIVYLIILGRINNAKSAAYPPLVIQQPQALLSRLNTLHRHVLHIVLHSLIWGYNYAIHNTLEIGNHFC
jgi:hypothetical protein